MWGLAHYGCQPFIIPPNRPTAYCMEILLLHSVCTTLSLPKFHSVSNLRKAMTTYKDTTAKVLNTVFGYPLTMYELWVSCQWRASQQDEWWRAWVLLPQLSLSYERKNSETTGEGEGWGIVNIVKYLVKLWIPRGELLMTQSQTAAAWLVSRHHTTQQPTIRVDSIYYIIKDQDGKELADWTLYSLVVEKQFPTEIVCVLPLTSN